MQDIDKKANRFQIVLIASGVVATLLFGVFVYKEAFPEYKIYQKDYIALENFRSTYTGEPPPEFQIGIRQIVETKEDKGPANIDRCVSCHVALTFPHFSKEKIAYDINGSVIYDENGIPKKIPNNDDVWTRLDRAILHLENENNTKEAEQLKSLKHAHVSDNTYDVTKVLKMHPLIGAETRPFEFHPLDEYGCTSCHNGNGLGLTTEKAHGPLFDGQYEIEFEGPVPKFTENDEDNDPRFAKSYNGKPGANLLFQTTPIFVGALIQAKCMQCHQTTENSLNTAGMQFSLLKEQNENKYALLQESSNLDQAHLLSLFELKIEVMNFGVKATYEKLEEQQKSYDLSQKERSKIKSNADFLFMLVGGLDGLRPENAAPAQDVVLQKINEEIDQLLGSKKLSDDLLKELEQKSSNKGLIVSQFLMKHKNDGNGTIFNKLKKLAENKNPGFGSLPEQKNPKTYHSSIDDLTKNYKRGEELYISQGCYACHRISGFARGGVGPELTEIGKGYPWYIKQKMVWPQSTLKNSTMPNYHLDHHELEDLMTFLLGQVGENKSVASNMQKIAIKNWEGGEKKSFEKPISPAEIHDLRKSMTIFATEGCAACHRLKGFESNIGFAIEREKIDFKTQYIEQQWFQKLIPEAIEGPSLVKIIDSKKQEIDKRIVKDVRKDSILEEIEKNFPDTIESFYTPFRYANRAKNHEFEIKILNEKDPLKKEALTKELDEWKERVRRVLYVYIQEYGLGRVIGPRPNFSGVYRSDEWLMQHFRNPTGLIPNSIMPVFSFDDTKFYALTHMLDILGVKNRNEVRQIWDNFGFNPELAYQIYCSDCHGEQLNGNGPVSLWIYPIPKNLRNGEFLRNLTKENAVNSIMHGVKGTPMAPWGETPVDKVVTDGIPVLKKSEIQNMVDWIFSLVPGENVIENSKNVLKWQYAPENIHEELKNEGNVLETNDDLLSASIPLQKAKDIKDSIFDVYENENQADNALSYFIKPKYYTTENIEEGKIFFRMNCAVCHGNEGDGTGARGQIMQDAKPRKLNNLEWLDTRDDLRLLRSIKYGVAGTSMNPWGDLTSGLQRLQLVMFIRNLSHTEDLRKTLFDSLYESFDVSVFAIENARAEEFKKIDALKKEIETLNFSEGDDEENLLNFKKNMSLQKELKALDVKDQVFVEAINHINKISRIYREIGIDIIEKNVSSVVIDSFISTLDLNKSYYNFKDGKLVSEIDQEKIDQMDKRMNSMVLELDKKIKSFTDEKKLIVANNEATMKKDRLNFLENEIKGYEKLKNSIISGFKKIFEIMKLNGGLTKK